MRRLTAIAMFGVLSLAAAVTALPGQGSSPAASQSPSPGTWIYCFAGVGSQEKPVEYFSRVFSASGKDDQKPSSYLRKFVGYLVKTYQEDGPRLVGACSPNKTKEEATAEMENSKKNFGGYRIVDASWP
jgi:hypothetical protein